MTPKKKRTTQRLSRLQRKYEDAQGDYRDAWIAVLKTDLVPTGVLAESSRELAKATRAWAELRIELLKPQRKKNRPPNDKPFSIGWFERKIKRTDDLAHSMQNLHDCFGRLIEAWEMYGEAKNRNAVEERDEIANRP